MAIRSRAVRNVAATRYVTPLREGGSLPALVEADDDGLYVLKFRGAGQGPKALVAEVVVGQLARALGFPVPELVLLELDATIGRAEPDPEIQDLLLASDGLNLGVDFLPGALPFSPAAGPGPEPNFAADVVWLDALATNVDRTPQNPNLLWWHGRLWLIDHGAALYFHHAAASIPSTPGGASRPSATMSSCRMRRRSRTPTGGSPSRDPRAARGRGRGRPAGVARVGAPRGLRRLPAASARRAAGIRRRSRARAAEPFSYAVVRLVPDIERGERVNVGVILFCRPLDFLGRAPGSTANVHGRSRTTSISTRRSVTSPHRAHRVR